MEVHLRERSLERSTDAGRLMMRGAAEGDRDGEEERRKGLENGREQCRRDHVQCRRY